MNWYLMVWKKYAEFSGRARRTEYWMFTLFNVLAILVLAAIGGAGIAMSQDSDNAPVFFIPLGIYVLAALIPSLAVATRRFHDSGKSGWILLLLIVLGLIPFVGFIAGIVQIVFLCMDSELGTNQYGPNPKLAEQMVGVIPGSPGYAPMGYPAQPQPPMGYPAQPQPPMGYPAQAQPPMGYPAQPQPPMGYPAQPQSYPVQSASRFCGICGAKIEGASTVCGNCGTQV